MVTRLIKDEVELSKNMGIEDAIEVMHDLVVTNPRRVFKL
jgi:hypothetical protein